MTRRIILALLLTAAVASPASAVVFKSSSLNTGADVVVYRVQQGPGKWPAVINTQVWPDGWWGFSMDGYTFDLMYRPGGKVTTMFAVSPCGTYNTVPTARTVAGTAPNDFLVELQWAKVRGTGATTFNSLQCTP